MTKIDGPVIPQRKSDEKKIGKVNDDEILTFVFASLADENRKKAKKGPKIIFK